MGVKTMQKFTLIAKLLRKMQKLDDRLLQAKKVCKIGVCPHLYYLTCKCF
jgi:hypothetical protein